MTFPLPISSEMMRHLTKTHLILEGPTRQIYTAPLQGTHYKNDNFQVFPHLRTLIIGGMAETYIEEFVNSSDGRGAWHHLLVSYEGEDARNVAITAACKIIGTSTWEWNTCNFTLDDYTALAIRKKTMNLVNIKSPLMAPCKSRIF